MKIQVASDLHLEVLGDAFPDFQGINPTDADVLVIAGDIHQDVRAIGAFQNWTTPVVYVHGNHELYGTQHDDLVQRLRHTAYHTNVHYLECDELILADVRFLGCCLWTDYALFGENKLPAMREAEQSLNDHRLIKTSEGVFSARHAARIHRQSRAWLEKKLDDHFDGKTVVVTHHAPHPLSIHPRYAGNVLNTAFASNLSPLLAKADLWIHGHVHDSFDYEIAGTRVVANPRGYPLNRHAIVSPKDLLWENALFNPALTVEI
jgi:Icc-related predicted phosphoesterase